MRYIKQAVILAGGQGSRLRPLTLTVAKPMIRIRGKPLLEYIIRLLKKNGIEEVILLVGYLPVSIEEYFGDGKKVGLKITYSYSPVEADTGTRIKNALPLFDKTILLLYGDNYWPLDLKTLTSFYEKMGTAGLVTVYSNLDHATKNNMFVDPKGFVRVYERSRKSKDLNGVDIGFFIIDRGVFSRLPQANFTFEDIILPRLIEKKQLAGFITHHKYYGLSTHDRVPMIEEYFRPKKVVFLDRDGVINKRLPKAQYVTRWKDFEFLPRTKEALKLLVKKGYEMYIVSSQAGIARGIFTKKQVDQINNRMEDELKRIGVAIRGIYICPHGWNDGCFCRKPRPGLFFQCAAEHYFDLYSSYCIGDDPRDIIAGRLAGCKTMRVTLQTSLYDIVSKLS